MVAKLLDKFVYTIDSRVVAETVHQLYVKSI